MGISKKKLKNKRKAEKRVGPKAKRKIRKTEQIKGREAIKESKRKAAAQEKDQLDSIGSVDELFGSGLIGQEEGEEDAASNASDESSAGGFVDVGEDGDGDEDVPLGPEDLKALTSSEGAAHEVELLKIKESDPAFYKFLLENDQQLLDFRAPEDQEEEPGEVEAAPEVKPKDDRVMTLARFQRLQETARSSFTAFKATLSAYHAAVRSIEGDAEAEDAEAGEADAEATGGKEGAPKKRKRQTILRIADEATFSLILEWCLTNMLDLLQVYAGDLARAKAKRKSSDDVLDPTAYSRWSRVKVLAQIYWEETLFLLMNLQDPKLMEFVLRSASTKEALSFLWPFRSLRQRYFRKCCLLWSSASSHSVRLLSFLFLRNSAAMATRQLEKKDSSELDSMTRKVLRCYAEAASRGYSWRSFGTFRFMENCVVELLRIDDNTAYRIGYAHIRQLALVLRSACIAVSNLGETKKKQGEEKGRKRRALQEKQAQNLVAWGFVRSLYLWTRAVGQLPSLRPLAYPLAMVASGALKSKLTSVIHLPYVYHCLRCLNHLSSFLEAFVPVSAHILKALDVLLPAIDKAHREQRAARDSEGKSAAKVPELDVLLKFKEGQSSEVITLEAGGAGLCFLLLDHLGLLSRSPAFPEISAPVLVHLRRYAKHCRSEPVRRQLKQLASTVETTASDIRVRREALTEVPSWKRLFVFEADSAMAKSRASALTRQEEHERMRVAAESRGEEKRDVADAKETATTTQERRKQKKKRREERRRALEAGQEEGNKTEAAEPRRKRSKKIGKAPAGEDVVEEMEFSSGDDA